MNWFAFFQTAVASGLFLAAIALTWVAACRVADRCGAGAGAMVCVGALLLALSTLVGLNA